MKLFLIIAFVLLFSSACVEVQKPVRQELTISAAVSLKDAFTEIGREFSTNTNIRISYNFGGSGTLQQQIESGAPVDIFASAGEPQMDALAEKGLIDPALTKTFALNQIVMIVPAGSKIDVSDFQDLKKSDVKKIAVGNPKTVPVGQYAQQIFDSMELTDSVQPKLVFAENVRQVLEYVISGEVDAGIVYSTDAKIGDDKINTKATAPENSHKPIVYPIAIIKDSKNSPNAKAFIDFVFSQKGQEILRKHGFISAGNK